MPLRTLLSIQACRNGEYKGKQSLDFVIIHQIQVLGKLLVGLGSRCGWGLAGLSVVGFVGLLRVSLGWLGSRWVVWVSLGRVGVLLVGYLHEHKLKPNSISCRYGSTTSLRSASANPH